MSRGLSGSNVELWDAPASEARSRGWRGDKRSLGGGFRTASVLRWELGTASDMFAALQHRGELNIVNGPPSLPPIEAGPHWVRDLFTRHDDEIPFTDCSARRVEGRIYSWHMARIGEFLSVVTDEGHFYCQPSSGPDGYDNTWFGDDGSHGPQQEAFDVCDYTSSAGYYAVWLDGEYLGRIWCS